MHPVLERFRVLTRAIFRSEQRFTTRELRACRTTSDLLPAEVRPMDEIILVPMTFEQYSELVELMTLLEIAASPAPDSKKGT